MLDPCHYLCPTHIVFSLCTGDRHMLTTSLLACKKMGKPKPLQGLIMLVVSQVLCISLLAIAISGFPGLCGPHGEPAALSTASCRSCAHSRACCLSAHSDETLGSPHMKPGRPLSLAPLTGTVFCFHDAPSTCKVVNPLWPQQSALPSG